jgi:DNA-binding HxlR family transcriptional regulator
MALPRDYTGQTCSCARSLEVIGERWTLLIVRDAFYGVRRFRDFLAHLDIPRAVLAERLAALVEADVLSHDERSREYVITEKGRDLWPVVRSLAGWGEKYYAPNGALRTFTHADCGGKIDTASRCERCGQAVAAEDTIIGPGPGLKRGKRRTDPVAVALSRPRRLLEPMPLD